MENKLKLIIGLSLGLIITILFIWLYYKIDLPEEPEWELPKAELYIPELNSMIYLKCNLTNDAWDYNFRTYFSKDDVLLNCYFWYESKTHEILVLKIRNKIVAPSRKEHWLFYIGDSSDYAYISKKGEINNLELEKYNGSITLKESGYYKYEFRIEIYNITRNEIENNLPFYTGNEKEFPVKHYKIPKKIYIEPPYSFRVYSLEELDNIRMTSQQANATLLAAIISAWAITIIALLQFSIILTNKNGNNNNEEIPRKC